MKLELPTGLWADWLASQRIAHARKFLWQDDIFRLLWMRGEGGREIPMTDRALELGLDSDLVAEVVKDIVGYSGLAKHSPGP